MKRMNKVPDRLYLHFTEVKPDWRKPANPELCSLNGSPFIFLFVFRGCFCFHFLDSNAVFFLVFCFTLLYALQYYFSFFANIYDIKPNYFHLQTALLSSSWHVLKYRLSAAVNPYPLQCRRICGFYCVVTKLFLIISIWFSFCRTLMRWFFSYVSL